MTPAALAAMAALAEEGAQADSGPISFTRHRIDRIIALLIALGSLLVGTQAFFVGLWPDPGVNVPWRLALMIGTFLPLFAMLVACVWGRFIAPTAAVWVIAYPIALVLWPVTAGVNVPFRGEPWIWYLVNIATVSTLLVFRLSLQITWTLGVPMLFGVTQLLQGNFASGLWYTVLADVSFALILGSVLIALGQLFPRVADQVDQARAATVRSYTLAAAVAAAEQERTAVAALMHDSVLAALIAAERADTPRARALAVGMAQDALTRLANAERGTETGSDEPADEHGLLSSIEQAAAELRLDVRVRRELSAPDLQIPGRVVRAISLAATQAMTNSIQHAAAHGLAVAVSTSVQSVTVTVSDTGAGFDLAEVAEDRLGLRASVVARMAAVGGVAKIESGSHGTRVHLSWEAGS